jgi:hypothetical protein
MIKTSLEQAVRGLLSEQYSPVKQWEKEKKPTIDIGGHAHDPSGHNKSHIEEDNVEEALGTQLGMRHSPKKNISKRSLGALEKRNWGGNQRRRPSSYSEDFSYFAEEATKKVMKKLSEKKNSEKSLGKTATGQPGDTIDIEPDKTELTGPTR